MIFNEFKNDIVNSTKAGTSKEAIGMKAFGNYKLPYFAINKQIDTKVQFVNMQDSKVELNVELTHQLNLIKQLRQAFLREAMQGKLVNSTNIKETGQQLLSKIKTEKAQLIAEKKLKKEKELAPISEDEIPFEIPEHWAWCRLGAICIMNYGKGLTKAECFDNGNYPVFGSNGIVGYYDNFLTEKKSIIIGRKGSAGALNISLQPSWTTDVAYFIEENDNLNFLFLNYLLKSLKLEEIGKGIKPGLNRNEAYNIIIGLPPHHEQELIVAKLKELMTFCDGLEQSIKESQGYNEQLLQQVLREALRKDPVGLV
jgi:type I restriction enzyme S subunit